MLQDIFLIRGKFSKYQSTFYMAYAIIYQGYCKLIVIYFDRFQYNESFSADFEVKVGLYKTIEKMFPSIETRIKIDQQMEKFKRGEGLFGMNMAIATRDKKQLGML